MAKRKLLFWQIAFTYIGAVVGAGFASGQEILRFFGIFGIWGIIGSLLAGSLLAYFGYQIVTVASNLKLESYEQYLVFLFGPRRAKIIDCMISLFLLCGLAVMLVAGGSLFNQIWGWRLELGFILNAILLYFVMLVGVRGMLWLNTALIPCLLVVSVGVALGGLQFGDGPLVIQQYSGELMINNWLVGSLLYVSYNVVLGMVVLVTLGATARKGGRGGVIVGGLALGLLAAVLALALNHNIELIRGQDIPLLALAKLQDNVLAKGYAFVLWVSIITTALGNGLGLVKRLEQLRLGPKAIITAVPLLPTIALLGWPLGRAVSLIYPLLGYLGLILLIAICFSVICRKRVFW